MPMAGDCSIRTRSRSPQLESSSNCVPGCFAGGRGKGESPGTLRVPGRVPIYTGSTQAIHRLYTGLYNRLYTGHTQAMHTAASGRG